MSTGNKTLLFKTLKTLLIKEKLFIDLYLLRVVFCWSSNSKQGILHLDGWCTSFKIFYFFFNPLMHNVRKWSDTSKILQQMLEDFWSVSDHFGTLCIKGFKHWWLYYKVNYNFNKRYSFEKITLLQIYVKTWHWKLLPTI